MTDIKYQPGTLLKIVGSNTIIWEVTGTLHQRKIITDRNVLLFLGYNYNNYSVAYAMCLCDNQIIDVRCSRLQLL